MIVSITPEQKADIEKLVIQEESQQVFSLADMVHLMRQLVIFKKESMEMKLQNHELKTKLKGHLGEKYKPEQTPEVKQKIDD